MAKPKIYGIGIYKGIGEIIIMNNREEALEKSRVAFEAAKKKLEKAQKSWQDEVDSIVLRPVHIRNISREEAVKLAKAIEKEDSFQKIMKLGLLPEQIMKPEKQEGEENGNGSEQRIFN